MSSPYKILLLLFIAGSFTLPVKAASLASTLSGRILLSVEQNGEAWYINPLTYRRHFLGRPADAFLIMRELGLGINEVNFQQIAASNMPVIGNIDLAKRLAGRIILQVEKNGEAWYINPLTFKKHFLGRPADAFQVMRELGLGISFSDLAKIRRADTPANLNQYNSYKYQSVTTSLGIFKTDVIMIDTRNPNLKIKTMTALTDPCQSNCPALSLAEFYETGSGFAAINGTYFDTSLEKKNYYFFPVFDSLKKVFVNEDQLKYWTTGPLMAFDTNNVFHYFKDSQEFKSKVYFENSFGILQAAIGNKPRLIENGQNFLIDWEVDEKQRTLKTLRNAIGYKDGIVYLVVAHSATVPDLAEIMKALGVQYAINLDGGGSSALMYDGEYIIGPGRNIPNAIVFSEE